MSKKITDENGNTYVQKKPFYKKSWFWIVVVVIIIVAGGAAGSSDSGSKSNSTSATNSSKKATAAKWTQADFDSLKKWDMMSKADGGENMNDITAKYGKGSSSSDSSVNGMDTKTIIWTNTNGSVGSNVTLSFMKADDGSYLLYSSAATGLK